MRTQIREAERRAAVRVAARAWRHAGWITAAAQAAIAARFADDRQRQGPALRTLLFLLTWFAISSGFGTIGLFLAALDQPGLLLVVAGVGCIALAEVTYGPLKLLDFGPESALAWSGVGSLLAGIGWLLFETLQPDQKLGLLAMLGISAIVLGAGAWRWGSWLMALLAGGAALGILAGLPAGRLSWIAAGLAGAALSLRLSESATLGPSHRRCFQALSILSLAAVAFALFPESTEDNWIEKLGLRRDDISPIPTALAWLASAAFDIALVVFAIRTCRRMLLDAGALLGAALVVAVLNELDVRPYWAILCGAGGALLGGALLLRRFLDSGRGQERGGFTAAALLADPESRRLLESAAVIAVMAPAGRDLPAEKAAGLEGRGGDFGGGGSSSGF